MVQDKKPGIKTAVRPPIVTIMGHVDHGKTSILDKIRESHLVSKESGAITQHIGAYQVSVDLKGGAQKITFIDTPGHEAFAQMRSRGGHLADIVILVVSAEDGVKEQTLEAIQHAKNSGAPIIVALNKIDLPTADLNKVKNELSKAGVLVEELGGEVVCCPVSAKSGEGISTLLEMVVLISQLQGLEMDKQSSVEAVVVESFMDTRKGIVANCIVVKGTLHLGDTLFLGSTVVGKVKSITNDRGISIREALPSDPVSLTGMKVVLDGGAVLASESSQDLAKDASSAAMAETPRGEDAVVLKLIVKSDTRGTLEAVVASLMKLGSDEAYVEIIHQGVGDINDSDVLLASSASAYVVGFNVSSASTPTDLARDLKVSISTYKVIYELIDAIRDRLKGIQIEEEYKGKGLAILVKLFPLTSGDVVLGLFVTHGSLSQNDKVRILREGSEVYKGNLRQLRVESNRVKKVNKGQECGALLRPQFDFQIEDVIEVL